MWWEREIYKNQVGSSKLLLTPSFNTVAPQTYPMKPQGRQIPWRKGFTLAQNLFILHAIPQYLLVLTMNIIDVITRGALHIEYLHRCFLQVWRICWVQQQLHSSCWYSWKNGNHFCTNVASIQSFILISHLVSNIYDGQILQVSYVSITAII